MAASPTPAAASGWQQTTRNIAIGRGKTNRSVSSFSKARRVLGPLSVAYRVYPSYPALRDAATEDKACVTTGKVVYFAAGAVGFAVGFEATAFLVGLAFSHPIGWVAMGPTLIGSAICAYLFSEGGGAGVNAARGH
ncbi:MULTISPECIES: hypothetical protein [Aphanothece]|uniref:hypothetical protein n=1 Tax=Aphanothece TaxID=1121 RepID=UPI003984D713